MPRWRRPVCHHRQDSSSSNLSLKHYQLINQKMDNQFSYKVIEPNDDYKQARIEKSGITATFTMQEVEEHQAKLATFKKEREAEITVERAKMENIAHFHPIVLELTGE